ncbi:LacI family DNA-binding transcriptional regulator [Microbacterium sp. NPDC089189]|uniref:LacI family DNA-binding transcriptional regulator n=1 Tax=Microbacterium sp. NPDC089189 TaxID=3154972 RepID=UPI00342452C3
MTDSPTARRAPTLDDVARQAGVSLATASRVLNGSTRRVADAYRDKVAAAAESLGYSANLSAQATARGTSAVVSLVVADIADPYFGQIAAGVAREASAAGLHVTIAVAGRDAEREADVVRMLRGQRPHTVILATSRAGDRLPPELRREVDAVIDAGGRVVALGADVAPATALPIANGEGAAALARALARRGYARAILLGAAAGIRTSDDRLDGFRRGFEAAGGEIVGVRRGAFTRDAGEEQMRAALRDGVAAGSLVFGVSDVVAIGAMAAVRAANRTIGADIAVAGFDDIPTARDVTPGLSTVRLPLEEIGARALRLALDDPSESAGPLREPEVVLRASTPERA